MIVPVLISISAYVSGHWVSAGLDHKIRSHKLTRAIPRQIFGRNGLTTVPVL